MAASGLWKGKGREEPQTMDPEELNPVITYRHLLSSGLGVRNPLRSIGLCDMDAFYAACEQVRLGIDPSIPLVVRQWDALIAVNYPARKYGISRMDKVASALERCPHLRVVHVATYDPDAPDAKPIYTDNPNSQTHKVSLDHYRRESKKIIDVFNDVLPEAEIEKASIDEAFIDFTEPIRQHILSNFPQLSTVPPAGLDTPLPPPPEEILLAYPPSRATRGEGKVNIWDDLGTLVPVSGASASASTSKKADTTRDNLNTSTGVGVETEPTGEDGTGEGPSTPGSLTSNGRSRSAELEGAQIDHEDDTHPPSDEEDVASGVAPDPCVPSDAERPPTWHDIALSIAASLMLKMRDEVKTRLGYTTSAGIARNKFLAKLVASYKKRDNQTILRNAAIPNYLRPLPFQKIRFLGGKLGTAIAETYEAQTVGDLLNISLEEMQRKLGENSIWVWEILRGIDRSEVKEKPSITKSMGASKNLQHPITHPSEGAHWLRILAGELAFRLVEAREDSPGLWPKTLVLHVRQSYDLTRSKQAPFPYTRAITTDYICKTAEKLWAELVGTGPEYDRNKAKGNATAMKITNVFLAFTGVEAMATGQRRIEGFFAGGDGGKRKVEEHERDEWGKRRKTNSHDDANAMGTNLTSDISTLSFRCPRCGKQVRRDGDTMEDREAALAVLKMEHEDFHFAQDLAKEGDGGRGGEGGTRVSNGTQGKKKKQKEEPKGIAKFFSPVNSKK